MPQCQCIAKSTHLPCQKSALTNRKFCAQHLNSDECKPLQETSSLEASTPPTLLAQMMTLGETVKMSMTSRQFKKKFGPDISKHIQKKRIQNGLSCFTRFSELEDQDQAYCRRHSVEALHQALIMILGPVYVEGTDDRLDWSSFYIHPFNDDVLDRTLRIAGARQLNGDVVLGETDEKWEEEHDNMKAAWTLSTPSTNQLVNVLVGNELFQRIIQRKWIIMTSLRDYRTPEPDYWPARTMIVSRGYFDTVLDVLVDGTDLQIVFDPIPSTNTVLEELD